jgi:O-acetylhomoserine (thiol)-lyase
MEDHMADKKPGFDTLAIHAGGSPDPATGARVTPIYQTTAYVFNDVQHAADLFALRAFGNIYTRIMNPTQAVLESKVAALEGGTAALAVASGHSAQMLAFHTIMQPGDEFVAARQLYGGSINQFNHSFKSFGWHVVWADAEDPSAPSKRPSRPRPRPSSSNRSAIPAAASPTSRPSPRSRRRQACRSSSTTRWPRPTCARPIDMAPTSCVHSLTKFMGGHGNSMGGVIVDGGNFDWSKLAASIPCSPSPMTPTTA